MKLAPIYIFIFTAFLALEGCMKNDLKTGSPSGLFPGLAGLPLLSNAQTRSISAENPTGDKGKGAMAIPDPDDPDQPHSFLTAHLGRGWKTRPFLRPKAGETVTLMDVEGPGIIQHIWMVTADGGFLDHGRSCVLRMYWDGEDAPSVEVPVTDFFAIGHDTFAPVNSMPVVVNPSSALNCFWPMPFQKRAKITFTNESGEQMPLLAYQIDYSLTELPDNTGYFHAQWRRASTAEQNPYVILDGVKGKGHYVGTFLAVSQMDDLWFGEGEAKFYLDGDEEFPTICGTGTEDYFLHSYGFPAITNTLFAGLTLQDGVKKSDVGGSAGCKWSMYRWHILDPVHFHKDIRVTIQALGGLKGIPNFSKRKDDIASVAYWYQTEPHAPFPRLPPVKERTRDAHRDMPISIFDIKKAKVRDSRNELTFVWRDTCRNHHQFHRLYGGFEAGDSASHFLARGVAVLIDRRRSGFLMKSALTDGNLSAEWEVSLPKGTVFNIRYALTISAAFESKNGVKFSVIAIDKANKEHVLLDQALRKGFPNEIYEKSFEFPYTVKKLRFIHDNLADDQGNVLWFYPEVLEFVSHE